ncbi:MAG: ubiquitin-like small modifier protein 1 [Candidatus Hodarchaeales archaeon]|jgi:molybdopterin synthase sulfur carrier subunit
MPSSGKKQSFTVTARFFGSFKQVTQKRDFVLTLPKGGTIANLLGKVIGNFPRLHGLLLDTNLQLGSWVVILINGRNMSLFNGIETQLREGDIIAIFPPVAGG